MSDIQTQDPDTTRPKFYKYESEDRQLLVDLLHESSDKLVSIACELDTTPFPLKEYRKR